MEKLGQAEEPKEVRPLLARARIRIIGTRPILFNHFSPECLPLKRQKRSGVPGRDPDEWRRTTLVDENGQLFIKPDYVYSCILAGAYYSGGKRRMQDRVGATLRVMTERIPLVNRSLPPDPLPYEGEVYLDVRPVRNPASRGRNIRHRVAASAGWIADFTIEWEDTLVDPRTMESIIRDAGCFCGLGDGRKIGFGRFEVKEFTA